MNAEDKDKVDALEIALVNLSAKDQVFAKSLVEQAGKRGLSFNQMFWVQKLLDRSLNKEQAPAPVQVGNFAGVYSLFTKAKEKLKFPKIYMQVDGTPVVLSLSGQKAKVKGVINVAGVGDFGSRAWYGRVMQDGTWQRGMKPVEGTEKVESLLKAMSRNPAKAAKEFGVLTGRCCFCGHSLKDEHSTAAGFGPVCATKWGLASEWKKATGVLAEVAAEESLKEAA
jgi:hypothetical protein